MGFLAEMVAETRTAVSASAYLRGLPRDPPVLRPSLRAAVGVGKSPVACIAEYKRVSPGYSAEALPDHGVEAFVRAAQAGHAAGFSCLATIPRFQGSPGDVRALARRTSKPVLFKDFVVDRRQLDAAERSGAAAVLLIARLETSGLLDTSIAELNDEAHQRGLETVLELHDPQEAALAAATPADLYGVNVRDLDTLQLDRTTAAETLRAAQDCRPLLGLSGVRGPEDVRWFRERGVDGFVVGTAVARATDPEEFISALVQAGGDGES